MPKANIGIIGASPFYALAQSVAQSDLGITSIFEIDYLVKYYRKEISRNETALPDNKEELRELVREKVPRAYYKLFDVFSKANFNRLSLFRANVNYKIELLKGYIANKLGYNPLYKMLLKELEIY